MNIWMCAARHFYLTPRWIGPKLQTSQQWRNPAQAGVVGRCVVGWRRRALWFAWTIVLHKFGCFFFWPGPFCPFTSTLAGCGGLWIVSAPRRHKGAFVLRLHHIHHVMPVRQIWLDVSVTLMWVQGASGPEIANFTLYCLFCSIDMGWRQRGKAERCLGGEGGRGEESGQGVVLIICRSKFIINFPILQNRAEMIDTTLRQAEQKPWFEQNTKWMGERGLNSNNFNLSLSSLISPLLLSPPFSLALTLFFFFQLQLSGPFCPQHSHFTG